MSLPGQYALQLYADAAGLSRPDVVTAFASAQGGDAIYDTISTTVWGSLRVAGVDTKRVKGWGRIFEV